MALSCAVRRQLLEASLPESTEVRLELQDYLARTGMAPPDFARRINYARETVYSFLNGNYSWISSNDGPIRAAIRGFIAAHPIATPVVSSGKLYETENARLLRQYFYEALDHGRAYYLYGAPGTQKTYVLQHLIAEFEPLGDRQERRVPESLLRLCSSGNPLAGPDETGGRELWGDRDGHGRPDSAQSAFRSRPAQGAVGL
jgi:hypothetical protein